MAALPESLLDDLDDLGSDEDVEEEAPSSGAAVGGAGTGSAVSGFKRSRDAAGLSAADLAGLSSDEDDDDDDDDDEDGSDDDAGASSSSAAAGAGEVEQRDSALDEELAKLTGRAGFRSVAKLRETSRFKEHMARVTAALAAAPADVVTSLEEWPEYPLIVSCNHVVAAIDEEVAALHRYIADGFSKRFSQLENIVPQPLEYIRAVHAIRNETDMTLVPSLATFLPSASVMVLTLTASTASGKQLSDGELADIVAACEEALGLTADKQTLLSFVASRMTILAPNVSALLGSAVAAQLVAIAGGLKALSTTPACNIQVFGQKKRALSGFARAASTPHVGVIQDCPLVVNTPADLKKKAVKVIAAKVALAARIDVARQSREGDMGALYFKDITTKIAKWQEPPPGKQKKPLRAPDDYKSKRRGGRRARKLKEKMGLTNVRKEANRMAFGGTAAEYGDSTMGRDLGMLSEREGSGRLRVTAKKQPGLLNKKRRLQVAAQMGGSSGATGGFASSVAFTGTHGLELVNPQSAMERLKKAQADAAGYFSATGTFSTIRR